MTKVHASLPTTAPRCGWRGRAWLAAGLLAYLLPGAGWAQNPPGVSPTARATEAPAIAAPAIPLARKSPRATMQTFIEAMRAVDDGEAERLNDAIATLDLDAVNPLLRAEKGRDLAWILREAILRTREPDLARFSTRNDGAPYVFQTYASGRIELVFDAAHGWRFGRNTLAALPAILEELRTAQTAAGLRNDALQLPLHLRLRAAVPSGYKQAMLGLEQWQWLGIGTILLLGFVLDRLLASLLAGGVRVWRRRFARGSFRGIADTILRPLGLMALAFTWWAGLNVLGLPDALMVVLLVSVKFLACFATVWAAYRLVDLLAASLHDRALTTVSKFDDAVVPLVTKSIKALVTVLGLVFIADNIEVDITSLLAGLGLGGLAIALAAKDVIGNLFGSVTVLLDQTYNVGDWVVIGEVEGTVEHIGFRSTRIRTFKNSLVSVPNSLVTTVSVDNLGSRIYRTFHCKLALTYGTPPARLEAFCEGIRELVRVHPYTRKDHYQVYLNELGESALLVMIYLFWQVPDWGTELRERHRFLVDCLRLAEALGIEFAYPPRGAAAKPAAVAVTEAGAADPVLVTVPEPPAAVPQPAPAEPIDGRRLAREIVATGTGLGVKPPPVTLADYLGEDTSG